MSQTGKVALVTGGAQGIGRAMVEHLLQEGANVVICDLKEDVGTATAAELSEQYGKHRILFLQCDVTDDQRFEDCFKSALDKFSHLDIVVNNAGIVNERDDGWRKCIEINYIAVIQGTRLGFKYMGKDRGGRGGVVVNIGSIAVLGPLASVPVYSSTKAAVNQYSRSVGHEVLYNKTGVKVIALNPGMTETQLTQIDILSSRVVDDPAIVETFKTEYDSFTMQQPDNMGQGLIEALQKAENGSMWLVENDEPPKPLVLK